MTPGGSRLHSTRRGATIRASQSIYSRDFFEAGCWDLSRVQHSRPVGRHPPGPSARPVGAGNDARNGDRRREDSTTLAARSPAVTLDVRKGKEADIAFGRRNVRYSTQSGRQSGRPECPQIAVSRRTSYMSVRLPCYVHYSFRIYTTPRGLRRIGSGASVEDMKSWSALLQPIQSS